jgi:hypothetical protein
MSTTPYEDILGRYLAIATKKAGTAYEILAALVCKALLEQNTVIHDLRLRGDSGVKHQIDVNIQTPTGTRSLLIECKDFHERSKKVGLGVVRDFHSAVTDIRPDEAWIMTCVGFTGPALKYAKAKGIEPIVMRPFEECDKAGRIFRVCLNYHIASWHDPVADIHIDEADQATWKSILERAGIEPDGISSDDDAYFVMLDGSRRHFTEVITATADETMRDKPDGAIECVVRPEGRKLVVGGAEVPYKGIVIRFAKITETITEEIASKRLAELIVKSIGTPGVIVYEDQLRARSIDPGTGEIR